MEWSVGETLPFIFSKELAVGEFNVIDLIPRAPTIHPLPLFWGLLSFPVTMEMHSFISLKFFTKHRSLMRSTQTKQGETQGQEHRLAISTPQRQENSRLSWVLFCDPASPPTFWWHLAMQSIFCNLCVLCSVLQGMNWWERNRVREAHLSRGHVSRIQL